MAKLKNQSSAELFPILPHAPVGMARLAAEAEHADDGHLIEFKAMQARSILNRSTSKRLDWISYSINPYRGCEFGCKYCYARYTHEFLQPSPVAQVEPGNDILFSVPLNHVDVDNDWYMRVKFALYLNKSSIVVGPFTYLPFYESDIPKGLRPAN